MKPGYSLETNASVKCLGSEDSIEKTYFSVTSQYFDSTLVSPVSKVPTSLHVSQWRETQKLQGPVLSDICCRNVALGRSSFG